jgi:[acyl-carrier-protein] S-malonyltransferase
MGRGLIDRSSDAKRLFEHASALLGYDLLKLCLDGPESELHLTNYSQPALFVHSTAALMDFAASHPEAMSSTVAVAGLSLGEYSALASAGSLSFEAGVRLVHARGTAMQQAASSVPSGMASVLGLSAEQVESLCDQSRQSGEVLQVANLLCPGNIAISGHLPSLAVAEEKSSEAGATRFIRLNVAGAFHTDIMMPAVEKLREAIAATEFLPAKFPLYSNVDAAAHQDASDFGPLLLKQVVSPVRWEDTLRNLIAAGVEQFYEIGAGRVLAGTLKRIDRKAACECFGD